LWTHPVANQLMQISVILWTAAAIILDRRLQELERKLEEQDQASGDLQQKFNDICDLRVDIESVHDDTLEFRHRLTMLEESLLELRIAQAAPQAAAVDRTPAVAAGERTFDEVKRQLQEIDEAFAACWTTKLKVDDEKEKLGVISKEDVEARCIVQGVPIIPEKAPPNNVEYDDIPMTPDDWHCRWLVQKLRAPRNTDPIDLARKSMDAFLKKLRGVCYGNRTFVEYCRQMRSPDRHRLHSVLNTLERLEKANFLVARVHDLSSGLRVTDPEKGKAEPLWARSSDCWYFEQTQVCKWTRRFLAALDPNAPKESLNVAIEAATLA
jgi:hypothetical protein